MHCLSFFPNAFHNASWLFGGCLPFRTAVGSDERITIRGHQGSYLWFCRWCSFRFRCWFYMLQPQTVSLWFLRIYELLVFLGFYLEWKCFCKFGVVSRASSTELASETSNSGSLFLFNSQQFILNLCVPLGAVPNNKYRINWTHFFLKY
jgi:hypothetical protein